MFRIITHSRDQDLQASLLCLKVLLQAIVEIGPGTFEISAYPVPLFPHFMSAGPTGGVDTLDTLLCM